MYKFKIGDRVVYHGKDSEMRCTVEKYGAGRTESINGNAPVKINTYLVRDDVGLPYYAEECQLTTDPERTIGEELDYLRSLSSYLSLSKDAHIRLYIGVILANGDENAAWNKDDKIFMIFIRGTIFDSCLTAQQVCEKLSDLEKFAKTLNLAGGFCND